MSCPHPQLGGLYSRIERNEGVGFGRIGLSVGEVCRELDGSEGIQMLRLPSLKHTDVHCGGRLIGASSSISWSIYEWVRGRRDSVETLPREGPARAQLVGVRMFSC